MYYYVSYNSETGKISGFREVGDVYPTPIPTPYIIINTEQHADFFARGQRHRVIDGVWTYVEPTGPTLEERKTSKLQEIDIWTATKITGGFVSSASGTAAKYDCETTDQDNIKTMYLASRSPDFAAHPVYQGRIPLRGIPEGQTEKVILQHTAEQMQKIIDDMALHIGTCKQICWQLQEAVKAATTKEELELITWPE